VLRLRLTAPTNPTLDHAVSLHFMHYNVGRPHKTLSKGVKRRLLVMRAEVRSVFAVLALGCIAVAAYLAFDWADYGLDSTCGNLIRRKSEVGPCANIMRNRLVGVVVLIALAIVLAVFAARLHRAADSN
jgi:hypothetical protein